MCTITDMVHLFGMHAVPDMAKQTHKAFYCTVQNANRVLTWSGVRDIASHYALSMIYRHTLMFLVALHVPLTPLPKSFPKTPLDLKIVT